MVIRQQNNSCAITGNSILLTTHTGPLKTPTMAKREQPVGDTDPSFAAKVSHGCHRKAMDRDIPITWHYGPPLNYAAKRPRGAGVVTWRLSKGAGPTDREPPVRRGRRRVG